MTNDNKLPVEVATMQPQAPPPPNEVFIRVGTTLYKVVDQPTINGGKVRKRIPWNMETLRQDYGKEFIKYVHKYDGFCNTSLAWTICNCSISDLCRNFQFFCLCLRRGTQARPRS